ncbi:MAG: leucine-rich repeat protein [Syntrophomonadaceae bacterium]|nr:leucine-rich repeat protein [Syntrophomonadaceae bacterium]
MKKVMVAITLCCLLVLMGIPVYAAPALAALPLNQNINTPILTNIILAPSQLIAVADGTSVTLTWTDNSSNETVFDIERKDNGGSFNPIATVRSGTTSYVNSGLNPNTQYTYRVRAMTSTASSAYSNEAAVTTGSATLINPNITIKPDKDIPMDHLLYDYKIINGNAEITKYKGPGGDVIVPSTLGGAKVTLIDTLAFTKCSEITSIVVPDTVTRIGMDTFRGCTKLKKVTLPDNITSIGLDAFAECSSLSSINLPTSLSKIELGTFNGCSSLTEILFPSSITTIEMDAFYKCTGLTQVTIPEKLVNLSPTAFAGCSKLAAINIAEGNPVYTSIDGILYSKDKSTLLVYPNGKITSSVTIADHVKSIGPNVFVGLSNLKSVVFPSGLTSIGNNAFRGAGLTSLTFPAAVKTIDYNAFEKCTSLKSISIPGTLTNVGSGVFQDCTGLTSVSMVNGVQTIGIDAFNGCSSLKGIHLPSTVQTIEKGAFQKCPELRSIWFYGNPPSYIDWDAVDYRKGVQNASYDQVNHYTEVILYYPRTLEIPWAYEYEWDPWGWSIAPFDPIQTNLQQLAPGITLKDIALPGQQTSSGKTASGIYPGPLPDGSTAIKLNLGKTDFGVNGQSFSMEVSPIILESRLLLPVKYVAEPLGATAAWNQEEQKVTVTLNNTVIELWIGKNKARVNGKEVMIDPDNPNVKPVVIPPGRTMLPLRFLGEALGCEVGWDQNLQQATLTRR